MLRDTLKKAKSISSVRPKKHGFWFYENGEEESEAGPSRPMKKVKADSVIEGEEGEHRKMNDENASGSGSGTSTA